MEPRRWTLRPDSNGQMIAEGPYTPCEAVDVIETTRARPVHVRDDAQARLEERSVHLAIEESRGEDGTVDLARLRAILG